MIVTSEAEIPLTDLAKADLKLSEFATNVVLSMPEREVVTWKDILVAIYMVGLVLGLLVGLELG